MTSRHEAAPAGEPDTAAKIRFLLSRCAPGDAADAARIVETHMSWVVVAGDFVLKMKKPVRYPFLDFTTIEARERHCRAEVRLNRRLARDTYPGLLAMQWHEGRLSLVPEEALPAAGRTVDWLVHMRRLPAERMLDRMIAAGDVGLDDIDAIVAVLAPFYRQAPRTYFDADAYVARFRRIQTENRSVLQLPRFSALDAEATLDRTDRAIDANAALLGSRVRSGKVVDGHGDLRPEHVCLLDPPRIIDCLEFSSELRQVDPFDELAYLGLECGVAGAPWIAQRLIARAGEALGDRPPDALLGLYVANRAMLRARLVAAHLLDAEPRLPAKWLPLARRYLDSAERALEALDRASDSGVG